MKVLDTLRVFCRREWRILLPILLPLLLGGVAWVASSSIRLYATFAASFFFWRVLAHVSMVVLLSLGTLALFLLARARPVINRNLRLISATVVVSGIFGWGLHLGMEPETHYPAFTAIGVGGVWAVGPGGLLCSSEIGLTARQCLIKALANETFACEGLVWRRPITVHDVGIHFYDHSLRSPSDYAQHIESFAERSSYLIVVWGFVDPTSQHICYQLAMPHLSAPPPDGRIVTRALAAISANGCITEDEKARLVAKVVAMLYERCNTDWQSPGIALALNHASEAKLVEVEAMLKQSMGENLNDSDGFASFLRWWRHEIKCSNSRAHTRDKDYHNAAMEAYAAILVAPYPAHKDWRKYLWDYETRWRKLVVREALDNLSVQIEDSEQNAPSAWEALAVAASKSPKREYDLALFDRLATALGEDPVPLMFKATAYSYSGQYNESTRVYENLIQLHPEVRIFRLKAAGAYGGLAKVLLESGSATEAEQAEERGAILLIEGWPVEQDLSQERN